MELVGPGGTGVTDHGALTGLGDDDHPQYTTTAEAQALVDVHVNDAVAAHGASAISFVPNGTIAATDVQAAIQEVRDEAGSGSALTVKEDGAVVDATVTVIDFLGADFDVTEAPEDEVNVAISAALARVAAAVMDGDSAGGVLSGTYPNPGFAVDMATQAELDAHINDGTDAHGASAISFVPNGSIAATDVQSAIQEVRDEAGGSSTSGHIVNYVFFA